MSQFRLQPSLVVQEEIAAQAQIEPNAPIERGMHMTHVRCEQKARAYKTHGLRVLCPNTAPVRAQFVGAGRYRYIGAYHYVLMRTPRLQDIAVRVRTAVAFSRRLS